MEERKVWEVLFSYRKREENGRGWKKEEEKRDKKEGRVWNIREGRGC